MAWNDPGGGGPRDPWGGRSGDQGPPDLDESLRKLQAQISGLFGGRGGGGGGISLKWFAAVLAVIVVGYGIVGIYQLDAQERGVVFRFGKAQDAVKLPGLHWNPPIIDRVVKVVATRINEKSHSALMLTQDENIVDISMTAQYFISDPVSYLVQVNDPDKSVEHAMESALRHVVGSSTMDNVITEGRAALGSEVQERLQSYLNLYQTGIQVSTLNIDESGPPDQVQEAFDDVQKAKEDEQRFVNLANAYSEKVVPEARGAAQRQLEEANAYRDQVLARAQGEAEPVLEVAYGIPTGRGSHPRPPVHRRHPVGPEPEFKGRRRRRGRQQPAVSAARPPHAGQRHVRESRRVRAAATGR